MEDRELLEMAAKAAGNLAGWCSSDAFGLYAMRLPNGVSWNPLDDDGDALRLAVAIPGLNLQWIIAEAWHACDVHEDRCAYVRRAIVRAAAEIGRAMP